MTFHLLFFFKKNIYIIFYCTYLNKYVNITGYYFFFLHSSIHVKLWPNVQCIILIFTGILIDFALRVEGNVCKLNRKCTVFFLHWMIDMHMKMITFCSSLCSFNGKQCGKPKLYYICIECFLIKYIHFVFPYHSGLKYIRFKLNH